MSERRARFEAIYGSSAGALMPDIPYFNGLCEEDLVDGYLQRRSLTQEAIDLAWEQDEEKPFVWPEKLLMIYDWGCNIYSMS